MTTRAPERLSLAWMDSLSDADLIDVEYTARAKFYLLERREKKVRGDKYLLMRGPAELMDAWDRWSRILSATRDRSLKPKKAPAS